jgi:translation elongation factor EF-1alpha
MKVMAIKLSHRNIKKGEKIMIEGEKTFLEEDVFSIHFKGKEIEKGIKGTEVGVKIRGKVKKGDKVFLYK